MFAGLTKFIILAIFAVIVYLIYKVMQENNREEEFENERSK